MVETLEKGAGRYDMALSKNSNEYASTVKALQQLLLSHSVLSKQSIIEKGLFTAIIDDSHLFDEEGRALVTAFKNLGADNFHWCNTSDLMDLSKTPKIHTVRCTYDSLEKAYFDFDESIPFWDHILFLNDLRAVVLHTAHDHIIYAGSKKIRQ